MAHSSPVMMPALLLVLLALFSVQVHGCTDHPKVGVVDLIGSNGCDYSAPVVINGQTVSVLL